MCWIRSTWVDSLISHRLQWSNGSSSGAGTSIYYWKRKANLHATSVPCVMNMQYSSVRTASGRHRIAGTVYQMPIGVPLSIGHSCGLQHTTLKCPYSHWDFPFALVMVVHHVQKQSRYANIKHTYVTCCAHILIGNESSPCCPFQADGPISTSPSTIGSGRGF
jgi:hypothetical protein